MSVGAGVTTLELADLLVSASPPAPARSRAAAAILDTVGVLLAGVREPASRIAQEVVAAEGGRGCRVLGTPGVAGPTGAALAGGTAAHALDYDDMCFVSLAHPSAPLVPAILAAGELVGAPGRAVLDAYTVGFELEARLGSLMNPRHYERGWHCTSTLGTIGAAAAVSRMLGLEPDLTANALGIAASCASGIKENFGTMVKPLHAGLAARNGVLASLLARRGITASALALTGPQGILVAMDSERTEGAAGAMADIGARWEILGSGVTVKLFPSCAATHPTLDAILDLQRSSRFIADDVEDIEVAVDSITPTVLIHAQPATGLEGKFSMQFCVAAAVADGRVGIDTFERDRLQDRRVAALMPRVTMRADSTLNGMGPPLTEARLVIRLRDGRTLTARASGARGYPGRPASDAELARKFLTCARRTISDESAEASLAMLRDLDALTDVRALTERLRP
jgi:2-methylcitrate dehydratase PrpD